MKGTLSVTAGCALVAAFVACAPMHTRAAPDSTAAAVGKRLAENWLQRRFLFETTTDPGRYNSYVHYAEVATWYGALELARRTHDADLGARLVAKFDRFRSPAGMAHVSTERHVDFSVFGVVPLEIHRLTGDSALRTLGLAFADRQWSDPTAAGLSREARYWADDLFMLDPAGAGVSRDGRPCT